MDIQHADASDLPAIVLIVEDDRDTLDMYSAFFEMSGMWVATSTSPADALKSIGELRPDAVVTDLGFTGVDSGSAFVHRLKSEAGTQPIPVIVLSGRSIDQMSAATVAEADLCLVKPVLPDALLANVQRLIAASAELRQRSAGAIQKTAELAERSGALVARARQIAEQLERPARTCPACSEGLEWIETGDIGGVSFDYYRWCRQGCGLYCYDRAGRKWTKLA